MTLIAEYKTIRKSYLNILTRLIIMKKVIILSSNEELVDADINLKWVNATINYCQNQVSHWANKIHREMGYDI